MLEEARKELEQNHERSQFRIKHTISRLPGFFPRKAEMKAVERVLDGDPSFTVLFGASSVGKVNTSTAFHIHIADFLSLSLSLSPSSDLAVAGGTLDRTIPCAAF